MYLPTFWKMWSEAAMHKSMKLAGWGLPVSAMSKSFFISHRRQSAERHSERGKEALSHGISQREFSALLEHAHEFDG